MVDARALLHLVDEGTAPDVAHQLVAPGWLRSEVLQRAAGWRGWATSCAPDASRPHSEAVCRVPRGQWKVTDEPACIAAYASGSASSIARRARRR